jgi:hypothetical protein
MTKADQMKVVQNPAIEVAQAEFFAGTVDDDGARVLLGDDSKRCSLRTLERFIADGLPHVKYGNKRRFVVARMREWMMARERSRSCAPRPRGRPSRKVTADRIATVPLKAPASSTTTPSIAAAPRKV